MLARTNGLRAKNQTYRSALPQTTIFLLLSRSWGAAGSPADVRAVDDKFNAAVELPAFGGFIGRDRLHLAKSDRRDGACGDSLLDQKFLNRAGPAVRELPVIIIAADAVRVTLDLQA